MLFQKCLILWILMKSCTAFMSLIKSEKAGKPLISDAFRYDIAVELAQEINGKYRFSYIDQDSMEAKFVSVPEHGGGSLIPDGRVQLTATIKRSLRLCLW